MASWKTIRITKPCRLRIDNGNLLVEDDELRFKLSLEDTDSIVFEGDRFMISAKVLSALSHYKIATLFCDEYYLPSAILHPYHQSSLATKTLKAQLAVTPSYADKLWQRIIIAKIGQQREVLEILGKEAEKLKLYITQVREADKYGAEAKSAKYYWNRLFDQLVREPDSFDIRNQALNYAYALVRSLLTRDLSAAGFLPALGIWHDNKYNAFNLSDDLIEPFRPILDIGVYRILEFHPDEEVLTPQMKKELINLLDIVYIEYEKGSSSLRNVSRLYVQFFKRSVEQGDAELLSFPVFDIKKLDECL
ncbi:type II CRISPR-associated endonuclease Cas1 [Sulfurovum lithotrophicum]|uniref:type II CRISPR-associated endonuclease Cas1 n=1 Tax=Sulfurovum lithotrophicum TaxID=206403 RepID=UPI000A0370BB|nr:type II CRISPR-associated endonuclease Cas1 [Sulfurovum lithotrophicum]